MTAVATSVETPVAAGGGARALSRGAALARYAGRRLLSFVVSLWVLATAAFLLIRLIPGDPVRTALGEHASPEAIAAGRAELGLDLPLWKQYGRFIVELFRGDLGQSSTLRLPVLDVIVQRAPMTLLLTCTSIVVVFAVALAIGFLVAALTEGGQRPRVEIVFAAITGFIHSIPEFVLGVVLVFAFAVSMKLLPVAGAASPASLILPIAALCIGGIAGLSRVVRVETLRVLDQDYMKTARAKRLWTPVIYLRHALPNVLTAALSIAGLQFSGMLSGTVVIENVFALPGLGTAIVNSILMNDYRLIQGLVLTLGAIVLTVNLAVDLVIARFNPEARLS
ncbi:ABC transporter permease [Microbacterium sp.]|uniref:ABC transporter permease n=1 Tax=Microbacterium sp. TaxID=51671 RepID=UPI0033414F84